MEYKLEKKGLFNQSLHVLFCLDDSKSMDSWWDDVKKGCRSLIIKLYENHENI